jgi:hypothetical protein
LRKWSIKVCARNSPDKFLFIDWWNPTTIISAAREFHTNYCWREQNEDNDSLRPKSGIENEAKGFFVA